MANIIDLKHQAFRQAPKGTERSVLMEEKQQTKEQTQVLLWGLPNSAQHSVRCNCAAVTGV